MVITPMFERSTQADLCYDARSDTYRFTATNRDSVGTDILLVIADITGIDPHKMGPMIEFVDEDGVEQLFDRDLPIQAELSFEYLDFHVTVDPSGEVSLSPQPPTMWERRDR